MFEYSLSTFIFSPTIIFLMFYFFTKCSYKKTASKIHPLPPGPTPLPFIGCIIQMLQNRPTFRWIDKLMEQYDTPILCIRIGPSTHIVVVTSPDIACEFLKKQDAIFSSRPEILSAYLTSEGYCSAVMSPLGNQWKKMRKIVNQSVLSLPKHKWLQPKRDGEANHLLLYIYNQIKKQNGLTDGGLVNIRTASQHYCGNLLRHMIFGSRFFGEGTEDGGPGKEETEHVSALFTILEYLYAFCITDYFQWLRGKTDFDGHEKIIRTANSSVRKYHDPLIVKRIQMWNDGVRNEEDDLLDVLIKQENPKLTLDEIKAQSIELMIATIDNPSNAVEWAMGEMINEPRILERAVKELDSVVGTNRLVQEVDLPRLNYIKACLKEAFRLHPFAPFNVPHVSVKDTVVGGYFIPKGSHVLLSRRGLGRNPNVWINPKRFDPDRHLVGDGKEVVLFDNELRMLSFSTGRRGCPGVMLGSTITTMLLARMIQGFSWEVPYNVRAVNLAENHDDLRLFKPLVAIAKPRLPQYLYPKH